MIASVVQMRHAPALTDRDTILIVDFENRTGEEVFARERMRRGLLQRTRSPDDRVGAGLTSELCQRTGATLTVHGRYPVWDGADAARGAAQSG